MKGKECDIDLQEPGPNHWTVGSSLMKAVTVEQVAI